MLITREQDTITQAVRDVTSGYGLKATITRKEWPADGIVYVQLSSATDSEWALLDENCEYDKAYLMLERPAKRLARRRDRGL